MTKQEIEYRIETITQNLNLQVRQLIDATGSSQYDEAIRQINHMMKHLNALRYTLSVYDDVVK